MRRSIGASSTTRVNLNDYSDDPDYARRPLTYHAAMIVKDREYLRHRLAQVERQSVVVEAAA